MAHECPEAEARLPKSDRALPLAERAAQSGHQTGGPRCAACGVAATAPIRSDYRGQGIIEHHWQCHACSHEWSSSVRVLE